MPAPLAPHDPRGAVPGAVPEPPGLSCVPGALGTSAGRASITLDHLRARGGKIRYTEARPALFGELHRRVARSLTRGEDVGSSGLELRIHHRFPTWPRSDPLRPRQ